MQKSKKEYKSKIIGVIPARSGSKGVSNKNIRLLGGYPLIAYSIIASELSFKIERTIVSTDSQEIADIALFYGAEAPFLRPKEFATDSSRDIDFVQHLLGWLGKEEGYHPEYLVHLRPTTPLRDSVLVDGAVDKILGTRDATSLRSVHETKESPYKLFAVKDGFLEGLFPEDPRPEYYNLPRQAFSPVYYPNGYVDIIKSEVVINSGSLHGARILSYITPVVEELDRLIDFERLEFALGREKNKVYDFLKTNFEPMTAEK